MFVLRATLVSCPTEIPKVFFCHRIVTRWPGMQEGVMMHDMAITEDFAILLDMPLVFRPEVRSCSIW